MQMPQSRRDFVTSASFAVAAGLLGPRGSLAGEAPPEITTIRILKEVSICGAPMNVAEKLLRAEGFSEIRYVEIEAGSTDSQMLAEGKFDVSLAFAPAAVRQMDAGAPITLLAGVHPGCYELFAHEPINSITDLKGRSVAIPKRFGFGPHLMLSVIAAYVGLDPVHDINWVPGDKPMELFVQGRSDAFLGFPPEPQELRERKIGRVIVNTTIDRPWSQYFCCMLAGNTGFIDRHPVATKRAVRAILKATNMCAAEPNLAAQRLIDGGFTSRYDYALQALGDLPFASWREYDPEDTLRFYALRLHELGLITSDPNTIIPNHTDWRFMDELKRELKA
jgi:NitT/TauT family transport system substrate-binding protein